MVFRILRLRCEKHLESLARDKFFEVFVKFVLSFKEVEHVRDLLNVGCKKALDYLLYGLIGPAGRVRNITAKDLTLLGVVVRRRHWSIEYLLDQLQLMEGHNLLKEELDLVDLGSRLAEARE